MRRGWAISLAFLLVTGSALADQHQEKKDAKAAAAKPGAPAPGDQHKKLGYFVGSWKVSGDMKENPFMPAGAFSGNETCSWHDGKFAVVCKSNGKGAMGSMSGLGIMTWDMAKQDYVYFGVDNMGMADNAHGTLTGDSWVYTNETKMGDKTYKGRYSMDTSKPDEYTYKWEMSEDGTNWKSVMEGKNMRVKAAAKK